MARNQLGKKSTRKNQKINSFMLMLNQLAAEYQEYQRPNRLRKNLDWSASESSGNIKESLRMLIWDQVRPNIWSLLAQEWTKLILVANMFLKLIQIQLPVNIMLTKQKKKFSKGNTRLSSKWGKEEISLRNNYLMPVNTNLIPSLARLLRKWPWAESINGKPTVIHLQVIMMLRIRLHSPSQNQRTSPCQSNKEQGNGR